MWRQTVIGFSQPLHLSMVPAKASNPPFITTTNARELYDLQPGETVSEAIDRKSSKTP